MKFVIFAIAAVNAGQIVVPTIEWNQNKLDAAAQTTQEWAERSEIGQQEQAVQTSQDLSTAYSRYIVGEYANFGRLLKAFAELGVDIVDGLNVSETCNRELATECYNDFLWEKTTKWEMQ